MSVGVISKLPEVEAACTAEHCSARRLQLLLAIADDERKVFASEKS